MDTCLKDYACCWDGLAAPMNCYSPSGRKSSPGSSGSGGMSVAGAVFLTMFMWCIPLAAIAYYFVKVK